MKGTLRGLALVALGNIFTPEAHQVLRGALRDPDVYGRKSAAEALGTRRDPADLDVLLAAVRVAHPQREKAFDAGVAAMWEAVATIGGERAAKELRAAAAKGSAMAARALVASWDAHCLQTVREAFAGDDAKLRGPLLDGFTRYSTPPLSAYYAVGAILAELPGADEKLKANRAHLLGWMQDPRGTDALGKLLIDAKEPAAVREAAVKGLYELAGSRRPADPAAVEPMRHACEHDASEVVKLRAKTALMSWGIIAREPLKKPRPPKKPKPPKLPDPKNPPDEREFPPPPAP